MDKLETGALFLQVFMLCGLAFAFGSVFTLGVLAYLRVIATTKEPTDDER